MLATNRGTASLAAPRSSGPPGTRVKLPCQYFADGGSPLPHPVPPQSARLPSLRILLAYLYYPASKLRPRKHGSSGSRHHRSLFPIGAAASAVIRRTATASSKYYPAPISSILLCGAYPTPVLVRRRSVADVVGRRSVLQHRYSTRASCHYSKEDATTTFGSEPTAPPPVESTQPRAVSPNAAGRVSARCRRAHVGGALRAGRALLPLGP